MFCTNCGQKLSDDVKRCPSCGTVVITSETIENVAKAKSQKDSYDESFLHGLLSLDGSGCLFAPLLLINPLFWHSRSLLKQAKEAAMSGDNALSEKTRKKSSACYSGAIFSSLLIAILAIWLLLETFFASLSNS